MKKLLASAAIALLPVAAFSASITDTIDDFNTPSINFGAEDRGGDSLWTTSTDAGSFLLGNARELGAKSNGTLRAATTLYVEGGYLNFENGNGANGEATVSYTGGPVDLTINGADAFQAKVVREDLAGLVMEIAINGGDKVAFGQTGNLFTAPFTSFSADLTAVKDLTLYLTDTSKLGSLDARVDFLGAVDLDGEVPLPAGGVLLLTGLAGLGLARRRG